MDEKIASMAHDVLLSEYRSALNIGDFDDVGAMEDEILRRMGSRAERVDVLPDGHRV